MSSVVNHPIVEISDLAKAALALETDRNFLLASLRRNQELQRDILRKALSDVDVLVAEYDVLVDRIAALGDASEKLLRARVLP